ncbi:MAG: cytoplasmic protein [Eubacteriales bacterium]
MKKVVIFAFKGNPMCFVHVLLNAKEMHERGIEAKIVIEGEAVTLIRELEKESNPLYLEVKELGLIHSICLACSVKLEVASYNKTTGIPLLGDMSGHVSMTNFIEDGYEIITL